MEKGRFIKDFRKYFLFGSAEWMVKIFKKTNPVLEKGCIVDIETTGLNPNKVDYYNPQSHILTLGIYQGDLIRIYQLVKPDYERFLQVCRKIVGKTPQPRYAYAAHFEQQFLGIQEGWHDLMKYPDYDYDEYNGYHSRRLSLVDVTRNPCPNQEDWDIDSREVPSKWEEWLRMRDPSVLAEVTYHNYIDLLRERQLL